MPSNSPPTTTEPPADQSAEPSDTSVGQSADQPTQPSKLYFDYAREKPDLDRLDVKTVHPDTLLGQPAVFTVIGESHYVGLPGLDFHELCSCKPLSAEPSHETALSTGVSHEFRFEGENLDARTVVRGEPLAGFPGPDEATVAYEFGPEAWTTIRVGDAGYETYHTYPEYDLALYTRTRLTAHDHHDPQDSHDPHDQ